MNCINCKNILARDWLFCPFCGHNAPTAQSSVAVADKRSGSYGTGVRSQLMELAVKQAMNGGAWRESCAGILASNQIAIEEVEFEVRRRQSLGEFFSQHPIAF